MTIRKRGRLHVQKEKRRRPVFGGTCKTVVGGEAIRTNDPRVQKSFFGAPARPGPTKRKGTSNLY